MISINNNLVIAIIAFWETPDLIPNQAVKPKHVVCYRFTRVIDISLKNKGKIPSFLYKL